MSPYATTIARVRAQIEATRARFEALFELPEPSLHQRPQDGGWTAAEILEHVTQTSSYLLLVIESSTRTCLKRATRQQVQPGESDLVALDVIGHPDTFPWLRPAHMHPTGMGSLAEIRQLLLSQFDRCLQLLDQLGRGEGSLHRVRMSVQNLGKLDVYQWIALLCLHARRHSIEIERVALTPAPLPSKQGESLGVRGDDFYCDEVLSGRTAVTVVAETGRALAFHHTRPYWPVHIVVIPRQHLPSLLELEDAELLVELLTLVRSVAAQVMAAHGRCRVVTNLGDYQDSKHLHWHIGSGDPLR